ncbi:MAG: cold shock domain-containing protein [Wenzhouxiangella sp.]|nr:cold shock domain-containing protein [Wenzhouxiangella sp.]MCH8477251.1 cold shock domain-containing protein [Wenzhouxiangella sp.]
MTIRKTGKVKFFNADRNIGAIIPDSGGKEIAFDGRGLAGLGALRAGQHVSYTESQNTKGPQAMDVRPA